MGYCVGCAVLVTFVCGENVCYVEVGVFLECVDSNVGFGGIDQRGRLARCVHQQLTQATISYMQHIRVSGWMPPFNSWMQRQLVVVSD